MLKVLLVFPQKDRRTGLFIKRAFKETGCELAVVDPKVSPELMYPECAKMSPDILLCSRTPALAKDIHRIKKEFPSTVTVCWNTDARENIKDFGDELMDLFKTVDLMYTVPKGQVPEYAAIRPGKHSAALLQGIDPGFQKKEALTIEDKKKYNCEVMFAGNLTWPIHHGRPEFFDSVRKAGHNLHIYGNEGNYVKNEEHNKAVQCAKICIGRSALKDMEWAISVRDFQILGAGGFLLTNHVKGIEDVFKIGKECVVYDNDKQALELIKYYLKNHDARAAIAEEGYRAAHTKHTYKNRVETVIKEALELRK